MKSWGLLTLCIISLGLGGPALAQDKPEVPPEEDFSETPFTRYGEFSGDEDASEDEIFFQYGRFFGVAFGIGIHEALGNRGLVYQGGFPMLEFQIQYWFDFHFAIKLDLYTAPHFKNVGSDTSIREYHLGIDFKYYLPVENLSSTLTFAGPHVLLGFGGYNQVETFPTSNTDPDIRTAVGFKVGLGLEFPIVLKKTYFMIEGKLHFLEFSNDRISPASGIPDVTGPFGSVTASVMFTW